MCSSDLLDSDMDRVIDDDVVRYDKAGELDWRLGLSEQPKTGIIQKIIRFLKGEKY